MRKKAISICLSILFASTMFFGCSSTKDIAGETNKNNVSQQSESQDNKLNADKEKNDKKPENNDKNDNNSSDNTEASNEENKVNIDINSFVPNGNYKTTSSSNDLGEDIKYLKGNGTTYQVIGLNGKGAFVRVYKAKEGGLYEVYANDIEDSKLDKLSTLDYLDKTGSTEKLVLKAPVKVGTKWDGREIVEVGKDLKVNGITFKGNYAKVWERQNSNTTRVSYYCEGYGCVKYYDMYDKTTISFFNYTKIG